jgi:pSer/pThr/pTyr-binding forkhead associated (FHA) protein
VATLRIVSSAEGTPGDVAFALSGDEISLGRDLDNSIVLADQAVSRHHGKLLRTTRGWLLVDVRSGNGIWLNGQRVNNHFLSDGDLFRMGRTLLRFEDTPLLAPAAARTRVGGPRRAPGVLVLVLALSALFILAFALSVVVVTRSRGGKPLPTPAPGPRVP